MKTKTKVILIITTCLLFIGCIILYGVLMYQKGWDAAQRDALPDDDKTVIVEPVKGHPCTISIDDVRFYDLAIKFIMSSTGPGKGEGTIRRPEKWLPPEPPKNMLLLGLGGGYYAGSWLPSGSLDYLRRVGGFRGVDFYLGPGLSVSALDERPAAAHVAVDVRLSAAALW